MTLTIEINIKPEKVRDAKFAVEKLFNDASSRIKRDMDCRRTPTQVEEQHVESLGTASAVLGIMWRAMPS
jgi:hypothetical protein